MRVRVIGNLPCRLVVVLSAAQARRLCVALKPKRRVWWRFWRWI